MTCRPEFTRDTTSQEVASAFPSSVKDKVILITGVNSKGLGGETARSLGAQSPKLLILTGRTASKVKVVVDEIHSKNPEVECRVVECELSSQAAVRKAAAEINNFAEDINLVINNAAVMALPEREFSVDGIEMQFATNHVGHFLLTNLIMPKLISAAKKAPSGTVRVVNVSSFGHNFGPVRFSDLKWETPNGKLPESERPNLELLDQAGMSSSLDQTYHQVAAYANSKTANVLYSVALNKRLLPNYGIASFALHPGSIETELSRHLDPVFVAEARKRFANLAARKTLSSGASTQTVAALDPDLRVSGTNIYLDDCQLKQSAPWASDEAAADKLWSVSEDLVNEKFTFA